MHSYFKKLYLYTGWANNLIIDALAHNTVSDEYSIKVMSHVMHAQFIWLGRITGYSYPFKLWDILTFEQLYHLCEENKQLWLEYLEKASPEALTQSVSYSNSSGEHFKTPIIDIMAHMVNHSTYHRAQVAKALRDLGIAPPNTDYITYCRKFDQLLSV